MGLAARSAAVFGVVAVVGVVVTATTACHKTQVEENPSPAETREDWDPPTSAWGFHPVGPSPCSPAGGAAASRGRATRPFIGTTEGIAIADSCVTSVAASGGAIYWTDVAGGGGVVRSATRPIGQKPWRVTLLATEYGQPLELAATPGHVFWTYGASGSRAAGVRVASGSTRIETLSDEDGTPSRLVADGDEVFWVRGDAGGLRVGRRSDRGVYVAQELHTGALTAGLLAVSPRAVFAVSDSAGIVAFPRDRSRSLVLVPKPLRRVIDVVASAGWVYWLEGGDDGCGNGRSLDDAEVYASLIRVRETGGARETVADRIPDPIALSSPERDGRGAIVWVSTKTGPLRIDTGRPYDSRVMPAGGAGVAGRFATIGDAFVGATAESPSRVVLFSLP